MLILSEKHKLAVFSIPKIASSSIRLMMYEVTFGEPFDPLKTNLKSIYYVEWPNNNKFVYGARGEISDYFQTTVIRDPFKRLVSAYNFLFPKNITNPAMKAKFAERYSGLNPVPEFEEFLENFEAYKETAGTVEFHVRPYKNSLGSELDQFNQVFKLEEMAGFSEMLRQKTGLSLDVPHAVKSGNTSPIKFQDLSEKGRKKAAEICEDDYQLCKGYYEKPW